MDDFYAKPNSGTRYLINSKTMRDTLREHMLKNKLSYHQTAMQMKISKTFFANLLNGRRLNVGATVLAHIAAATGRRMEEFLERID